MSLRLKPNEIYTGLKVHKYYSNTNLYVFEKVINGDFKYDEVVRINPETRDDINLYPEKSHEGFLELFNNLESYCEKDFPVIINKYLDKNRKIRNYKIIHGHIASPKVIKTQKEFSVENQTFIIDQDEYLKMLFDDKVLYDPSLVYIVALPRIKVEGGNGTTRYISKWRKDKKDFVELEFSPHWLDIVPSQDYKHRGLKCPFSDEILLNAPYYRKEKLPSGSILLQMTEKTDFTKFDQNYWDKIMEIYEYFLFYQQRDGIKKYWDD